MPDISYQIDSERNSTMKRLRINIHNHSYDILIQRGILQEVPQRIRERYPGRRIALITDRNVYLLYGESLHRLLKEEGIQVGPILISSGEEAKSLDTLQRIYHQLVHFGLTREDLILTLGGGVVGDIGGFAAATFLRGIPFIQIPTTLLAQIDSSVGGKVAVNLPQGKNLVGCFYHPVEVVIDPQLLESLDGRTFHDGMAEIIKYGCIADPELFQGLLTYSREELRDRLVDVIYRCCSIKGLVVEEDETDRGWRRILNFGHTLGHALESYYQYQRYTHGEAVALGMLYITQRGEALGWTSKGTSEGLKSVLSKYKLPTQLPQLNRDKLMEGILMDKKSRGEFIDIVLLEEIGRAVIKPIHKREIRSFFGIDGS